MKYSISFLVFLLLFTLTSCIKKTPFTQKMDFVVVNELNDSVFCYYKRDSALCAYSSHLCESIDSFRMVAKIAPHSELLIATKEESALNSYSYTSVFVDQYYGLDNYVIVSAQTNRGEQLKTHSGKVLSINNPIYWKREAIDVDSGYWRAKLTFH